MSRTIPCPRGKAHLHELPDNFDGIDDCYEMGDLDLIPPDTEESAAIRAFFHSLGVTVHDYTSRTGKGRKQEEAPAS